MANNPILIGRCQAAVAAKTSRSGSFTSMAGNNMFGPLYDVSYTFNVARQERAPADQYHGQLADIPGARYVQVSFSVDARTAGTAGSSPLIDRLLRACGMVKTVASGSASLGSVIADPRNGHASVPTLGGTFGGAKSGIIEITITSVTADTSISFIATFLSNDGTLADFESEQTQTSNTAVTLSTSGALNSLTVDFGDPDASTGNFAAGDKFYIPATSSSESAVHYDPSHTPNEFTDGATTGPCCVDLQFIHDNTNRFRLMDGQGTFTLTGAAGESPRFNFTFTGVYLEPDQTTYVSNPVYSDAIPSRLLGVTATYNGVDRACFGNLTMDHGADVQPNDCAGQSTGYKGAFIAGFNPLAQIDPEADGYTTDNPFGDLLGTTTRSLSIAWGAAGNRITITASNAQLTATDPADRNGKLIHNQTYPFRRPATDGSGAYRLYRLTFD